ncbi:MAG: hypothetical protein ABTQ25_01735 [Nitrosomonas ureae]
MIKIAVLTKPLESATTFYRSSGVFGYLGREMAGFGWQVHNIGPKNFTPDTAAAYDILFAHRPVTDDEIRALRNAKLSGAKIWVDVDDLLWQIPASNPARMSFGPGHAENLRKAMVHADVITVSTPELANQVKIEYGRESIVVPNAWNDYALPIQEPAPIIEGEKIRIVYRGSNSHDGDLFAHRDAFREYGNIEFIFMGCMPWYFYTDYGGHMTTIIQEAWNMDIFGYFQRLIQLKPHFVVFPLEDNTFNRCKSNIAAIEATVAGAVCLASNLPEFRFQGLDVFSSEEELYYILYNIDSSNGLLGFNQSTHAMAKEHLETNLRLSKINGIRVSIAAEITGKIPTA